MEEVKNKEKAQQPKKLTYEELNNVATQLSQANQMLRQKLSQAGTTIETLQNNQIWNRLSFLFKSLKYSQYFEQEYVLNCAKEIQDIMTIKEEVNEDTSNENPE